MTQTIAQEWQSAAPANTMILGEHSVVYGHPALACALDEWIEIKWQRLEHPIIHIQSALGTLQCPRNEIDQQTHPKLRFVLAVLKTFKTRLEHGLSLEIHSHFSDTMGLGSSAAVLAAMLKGLNDICQTHYTLEQLWQIGHQCILEVQGRGSGTDLAASLCGGLVYFQPPTDSIPLQLQSIALELPTHLFYSGYKTPTAEVLQWVAKTWQTQPESLKQLYQQMGVTTQAAFEALKNQRMDTFYQHCQHYQTLMQTLKVSDATLDFLVETLTAIDGIHCAKISGSGLGDCVLALGNLHWAPSEQAALKSYPHLALTMSKAGAWSKAI